MHDLVGYGLATESRARFETPERIYAVSAS